MEDFDPTKIAAFDPTSKEPIAVEDVGGEKLYKQRTKVLDSGGAEVDPAQEATLQAVETAVDQLEAKLDTLNANDFASETTLAIIKGLVDGIETLLASLDAKDFATETTLALVQAKTAFLTFVGDRLKVDAAVTVTASIVNDSNIFLSDIFTITSKAETTIRTYTVPTGKTFRLVAFQVNTDNPLGANVQLKVDGVVKIRFYFDPNKGNLSPLYTAPVKIADAGQVVTITETAQIPRGEINTLLVGIES